MKKEIFIASQAALLSLCAVLACSGNPQVRPGKGMELVPGDMAEYSVTQYEGGQTNALPSNLMIAVGSQGENMEGVILLTANGDQLVKTSQILFDLTKEKEQRGELVGQGKETLEVCGKNYECAWEKRKDGDMTATLWTSPQLPFKQYAKIVVEFKDGRKQVTQLVFYDPTMMSGEFTKFQARLQKLMSQDG